MPDKYYTHQYSGEEIDAAVAAGRQMAKNNILINHDFRDGYLVDQRKGRIVKPNTTYYSDKALTTTAGTTSAYVTAYRYATGTENGTAYASFKLTDTDAAPTYYAAPANVVRGYASAGYCMDMWNMGIDIGVVLIESDGIVLIAGSSGLTLRQYQEAALLSELEGETLTWSAMYTILAKTTAPGGIGTTSPGYVRRCTFSGDVGVKNVSSGSAVVPANLKSASWIYIPAGWKIKIHALKLELGDTQTLAHQDSSGNWVLNELPSYADTLRACQRYFQRYRSISSLTPLGLGVAYRANVLDIPISTMTEMRTSPTVVFAGSVGTYVLGAKAFSTTAVATIAGSSNSNGGVLRATTDASMTVGTVYTTYLEAGYIDFSAEL